MLVKSHFDNKIESLAAFSTNHITIIKQKWQYVKIYSDKQRDFKECFSLKVVVNEGTISGVFLSLGFVVE